MMLAPQQYAEQFENASYQELLKIKNDLVKSISDFEHDYDMKLEEWMERPNAEVHYQWNLEVLGLIASMLHEAFNKEYEQGEKNMEDYYRDMREVGE